MLLANCFEQIVIKTRKLQLSFSQVPITYAITSSSMLSQDNNKSKGLISCLPLDKLIKGKLEYIENISTLLCGDTVCNLFRVMKRILLLNE